jgi:hypothetical protein
VGFSLLASPGTRSTGYRYTVMSLSPFTIHPFILPPPAAAANSRPHNPPHSNAFPRVLLNCQALLAPGIHSVAFHRITASHCLILLITMSSEPESTDAAPAAAAVERPEFKRDGKYERKRDDTPIEELFDLTKPIPKVCPFARLSCVRSCCVDFSTAATCRADRLQ